MDAKIKTSLENCYKILTETGKNTPAQVFEAIKAVLTSYLNTEYITPEEFKKARADAFSKFVNTAKKGDFKFEAGKKYHSFTDKEVEVIKVSATMVTFKYGAEIKRAKIFVKGGLEYIRPAMGHWDSDVYNWFFATNES